ncbi:MAG: Mov34/MPN/PAD-1 family protein [Nitrospirota bacterium]
MRSATVHRKRVSEPARVRRVVAADPMQVYLSENVFMGMVLSTVEVYKNECFGLLLGYRLADRYVVEHAIPYQSVRRGRNFAELRSDKWRVIQEVLKCFPRLDVLGDYHSHTMYGNVRADVSLSRDDIDYMEPNDLQVVIAVNENRRTREWTVNTDRTVSGSLDRYHFKIAAYYDANRVGGRAISRKVASTRLRRRPTPRLELAAILCPFAMAAGRAV